VSDKVPFSSLKLGQWFESHDFKLIKCELFTDYSEQTWNSICLRDGMLFYVRNEELITPLDKPKKFK
jgi:hypothetical protein